MALGMGVLGWPEDQFWASTMPGLFAAVRGYREANGVKEKGLSDDTRERLTALMDAHPDTLGSIRKTAKPLSEAEVGRLKGRVR